MKKIFNQFREQILYLFFGVVTTVVNLVVFKVCRSLGIGLFVSNLLAWILSVLTAFVTNKYFVFESVGNDLKASIREIMLFFMARIFSLGVDMVVIAIMVKGLMVQELISKIISNVVVIVINYVISKIVIFKK